jgi:ABC-type uncharacterized transport system ATPase subunit
VRLSFNKLSNRSSIFASHHLIQASQGRTTIVIAHRLSTIMNAQKIVVMQVLSFLFHMPESSRFRTAKLSKLVVIAS